jgi:hypothetical protein
MVEENMKKKCICKMKSTDTWDRWQLVLGLTGHVIMGILGLVGVVLFTLDVEKTWIIIPIAWIAINLLDYTFSFLNHRRKGHSKRCSLRYARYNILHSGFVF